MRRRRSAGSGARAAATKGTLPNGSMTRMSRIVADRSSEAIGAGGVLSRAGAVYRPSVALTGRHWHNRALPLAHLELIVCAFPVRILCLAAGVAPFCIAATVAAQTKPPVAPVKNVSDVYFGTTVVDPYRYMEDLKDPQVTDWMKAQADFTRKALDRVPQRDVLLQEITKSGDAAASRVSSVQIVGDMVYYLKRNASENIPKLYVRHGLTGAERMLFDPDALPAPEGKHYAIDYFQPSPDNKYVAYGISIGGSEESVLHVLETATAKETGESIDRANYATPGFLPEGRLVYSRLQKMAPDAPVTDKYQNQKVYVHTLGTNPDNDLPVLGAGVSPAVSVAPAELTFAGNPIGSSHVIGVIANGVQNEIRLYGAPLS